MTHDTPVDLDIAGMLTEVGVDAATANPVASIGDSSILRSEVSVELVPQHLPSSPEITLEGKIGEGEVTQVHLGQQKSMRRTVAVRKVHDLHRTPAAPGYVLSEAWMLGAFEHPNILPVYGVTKDSNGLPLVFMKAIECVPWTEILDTPEHPLGCPKRVDPLEFDIRRIIAVCNALEHAHFRGVIHRDVKPDNVLIGRDGTLYLHGWELAVALVEDPTGRFPCAADQTEVAGTPAYMAPELATKSAKLFAPTTDVYLLGATLHEVVTGMPRHIGENVFDAFYSAVASTPVVYDTNKIPLELAQILNKSMAANPQDRFQTMAEFRHALEALLRHRPSDLLTRPAVEAHTEFSQKLADHADAVVVRELFATAYTAYGAARNFWSRNAVVNDGLERLLREMIGYEIAQGDAERASELCGRLRHPDPELEMRIAQSEHATIPRAPKMATMTMETATDSPRDRRARKALLGAMVVVWTVFGLGAASADLAGVKLTTPMLGIGALFCWIALATVILLGSRSLFKTTALRMVVGPLAAIAAASAALLLTMGADAPAAAVLTQHLLVFFVAMGMLNAWFDWRLLPSTVAYLIGYLAASAMPEYIYWILTVSNLIGLSWAGRLIDARMRGGDI